MPYTVATHATCAASQSLANVRASETTCKCKVAKLSCAAAASFIMYAELQEFHVLPENLVEPHAKEKTQL